MSWQRILESARQNGFPVIVTDIAGREPMVIMPFDSFEEMNEVYRSSLEQRGGEQDPSVDSIKYTSLEGPSTFPEPSIGEREVVLEEASHSVEEKPVSSLREFSNGPDDVSHLSMEDRFYLEPIDDAS